MYCILRCKFNLKVFKQASQSFAANTGGLLGLFMGFSVLSIVEILYFLTLRPLCELIKYKKSIQKKRRSVNVIPAQKVQLKSYKTDLMGTKNTSRELKNYAESLWNVNTKQQAKFPSNKMYPYLE